MLDKDYVEHRLQRAEGEIAAVCERVNMFAVSQAAANSKLDSLLKTTEELKNSVNKIKEKPSAMLEKATSALIGAVAAGTVALLFK
ncbi:MAG: hypothetical protein GX345_06530 [Clostridiales bacterium]|nr:hypothetical protein [Clostridiales bacterium]